jgi:hypothetical protein
MSLHPTRVAMLAGISFAVPPKNASPALDASIARLSPAEHRTPRNRPCAKADRLKAGGLNLVMDSQRSAAIPSGSRMRRAST